MERTQGTEQEVTVFSIARAIELSYSNSKNKGFWDVYRETAGKDLQRALINEKLLLVVSEITEAMEELRSGHSAQHTYLGDKGKPEGFGVELADAVIRIFDLCGALGIPLQDIMANKMMYNSESRGHLHGRSF